MKPCAVSLSARGRLGSCVQSKASLVDQRIRAVLARLTISFAWPLSTALSIHKLEALRLLELDLGWHDELLPIRSKRR